MLIINPKNLCVDVNAIKFLQFKSAILGCYGRSSSGVSYIGEYKNTQELKIYGKTPQIFFPNM
jgi:hypothetical protein